MKPDIEYVYNKLKQLRFEFKESDRKLFPSEYTFDYGLDRYVRVDGNDLYISKDTFKPLEEELEYADKCHELEEKMGLSVEEMATILKAIKSNVYYFPIYDKDNNERLNIWQEDIYDDVPLLQTSIEDTILNNALKKFVRKG